VADLGAVTALLRDLARQGLRVAEPLATTLAAAGPALLRSADVLAARVTALAAAGGDALPAPAAAGDLPTGVRLLCAEWQAARAVATAPLREREARRLGAARAHLLARLHWGAAYPAARDRVVAVLEGVLRGSSLAECANSWLRPYAELLKGLGARFLPLFQLFRNAHVFARGKRAGHSPLELAGVTTPPGDWLDWLGLTRSAAATPLARSVRALPAAV
jgi:hypothetical protein